MPQKIIKVLVIDDHQLIIEGIRSILQDEEDVVFSGGVNTMRDAENFLANQVIDVALVDISMPDHSGVEVTKMIRSKHPGVRILALTMHEDIAMISEMISAGASGYLLKRTNMNEILDAIRVVANNEKYIGREVQAIMMDEFNIFNQVPPQSENVPVRLTQREKEILNLIAHEYTNGEIAEKLFISERTVETHRRNISTKTNTKSIVGLIKYALHHNLLNQEENHQ